MSYVMNCAKPLWMFKDVDGKTTILNRNTFHHPTTSYAYLPCGQCFSCRASRAREWALRCDHERNHHAAATFITLTYRELPSNGYITGSLFYRHVQLFWKRLRKAGYRFRYFCCGEYGSKRGRPHYHALIFGVNIPEHEILKYWKLGIVDAQPVYPGDQAGGYIAGYAVKKFFKKHRKPHLKPEFIRSSGGIGKMHCLKSAEKYLKDGFISLNGFKRPIPRYYRKVYLELFPSLYQNYVDRRDAFFLDAGVPDLEACRIKDAASVQSFRFKKGSCPDPF